MVEKDALAARIGLRWTVRVPWANLDSMPWMAGPPQARKQPGYLAAVLPGLPQHLLRLKVPIVAQGLYGIHKTVTTL